MSDCTNQEMGQLLHDYELKMLSAEDRHQFELHLYECDHCLALVREFAIASRIIIHDPDAKAIIEGLADESSDVSLGRTRKESTPFTKLLIAAVIVMVLAMPAYLYWIQPDKTDVVQTLELLPTRAGGSDVIYLEKGGGVEINFFVSESFVGEADLIISSIAGDTVINTPGFSDFNDRGLGSITLPVSVFLSGHYMLTIRPDSASGVEERVYMFSVK